MSNLTATKTTTRTICDHALALTPGRRYRASRPAAPSPNDCYPVTIVDLETGDIVYVTVTCRWQQRMILSVHLTTAVSV
jgi:hypothetical protein